MTHLINRTSGTHIYSAELATIIYLALPVAIFHACWLSLPYGIPCLAILALFLIPRCRRGIATPAKKATPSTTTYVLVFIVALLWTTLGGAGHMVYANADWVLRDAVLRDLVAYHWPVTYGTFQENSIYLRCPLAYFLVPAIIGKAIGLPSATLLLFTWTLMGVALLFFNITASYTKIWQQLAAIAVFILFSGMDIVGSLVFHNQIHLTSHLEWWAELFQFSSSTTQLFWVPNHALPGWLAVSLMLRHGENPRFLPVGLILVTITPLWSPLTAIGLFVVYAALLMQHLVKGNGRALLTPETILAVIIALPTVKYLTLESSGIPMTWAYTLLQTKGEYLARHALFIFLELAITIPIIILDRRYRLLTCTSFLFLTLLPLVSLGVSNDLVMRASIPALAIITLRTGAVLIDSLERRAMLPAFALLLLLVVGSATPFSEIIRAVTFPRWQPDQTNNLMDVTNGNAPHYLAWLPLKSFPVPFKPPAPDFIQVNP